MEFNAQDYKSTLKAHVKGLVKVDKLKAKVVVETWHQLSELTDNLSVAFDSKVKYNIDDFDPDGYPMVTVTIDGNNITDLDDQLSSKTMDEIQGAYVNLAGHLRD